MKEIWKPVKDYETRYEVSNFGNVRNAKSGKTLKGAKNKRGYIHVFLRKNGKGTTKTVHRLVAEAFVPNPRGCSEVNHIDENKQNNKADNLEWVTHLENSRHGTRGERIAKANTGNPKTSRRIYRYSVSGKLIETYASPRVAEEKTGISRHSITHALYRNPYNYAKGFVWKFE